MHKTPVTRRKFLKAAAEHKVVTQLGNQGHSSSSIRTFCEWIWDGAIGNVHTIHAGADAVNSGIDSLAEIRKPKPVSQPPQLDWDVWLGPAPQPRITRRIIPSSGAAGRRLATARWATGYVMSLIRCSGHWISAPEHDRGGVQELRPQAQADIFPRGERVTFTFPARGKRGPVALVFHAASSKPGFDRAGSSPDENRHSPGVSVMVAKSGSRSRGGRSSMDQSCGRSTRRQAASSNCGSSAPTASPRRKRQLALRGRSRGG